MVNRLYHRERLSLRSRGIHIALSSAFAVAWLFIGCTKSITLTDRYAVTKLQPGATLLFFLDSQSEQKSSQMEARIVRIMSRALEEANAFVWVLSSKEFCPSVPEPFYSPEDILLLLQGAQFKQMTEAKRIQYIVLVHLEDLSRGWSKKTHSEMKGGAIYNQRDTQHSAKATVIEPKNAEIVGTIVADCSASSGYGFGVAFDSSGCCIFPFAWYGGETEDLALRTLATNVAKFLADKDAVPNSNRPEAEKKIERVSAESSSENLEEGPKQAALLPETEPEVVHRIKLRAKAESNLTDQGLQKMIWERNFFNGRFNPGGTFPNAFVDNRDGTVTDKVTGLMWQKAGSPSELTFYSADKYVQELNSSRFGGYGDWRLPTMEELCSLLEATSNQSGRFMDSLFDPTQNVCWSADTNPSYLTAHSWRVQVAFYVNFIRAETSVGIADRFLASSQSPQSRYHVKAVRTTEQNLPNGS